MKSKIKVAYIEATNLDELKELVDRELEAIQVNVRNNILGVITNSTINGFLAQITYEEAKEILNEGVEINVEE